MLVKGVFYIFLILLSCEASLATSVEHFLSHRMDYRSDYFQVTSPHFRIIFKENLSPIANRLLAVAESTRVKLLKYCQCQFDRVTDVILSDEVQISEVYTSVFPGNIIHISSYLPRLENKLFTYTNWFEWVFLHEYTHVIHLNQVLPRKFDLSKIFGSWYRTNQLRPAWLKEGLAVAAESSLSAKGRKKSSLYRMMNRTRYLIKNQDRGSYPNLAEVSNFVNFHWPWNDGPYQLGTELVEVLSQNFSFNLSNNLFNPPANIFNVGGDDLAVNAGYVSIEHAWSLAKKTIEEDVVEELANIEKTPTTQVNKLTSSGYFFFSPIYLKTSNSLISTFDSPLDSHLVQVYLNDEKPSSLVNIVERFGGGQVSVSKSERFIAFDQLIRHDQFSTVGELFIYDLKEKLFVSMSINLGAHDPEIHPDGQRIIYVKNRPTGHQLCIALNNWTHEEVLFETGNFETISSPRVSPDGNEIVFTKHNSQTGGEDLLIWNNSGVWTLISNGSSNLFPSWSHDGSKIFLSSDITGVFNIFEISLKTLDIHQISNVTTGLLYPIEAGSSSELVSVHYSSNGWDLVSFSRPLAPIYTDKINLVQNIEHTNFEHKSFAKATQYKPELKAFPEYLYPTLVFKPQSLQPGVSFGSEESLGHRLYSADIAYDTKAARFFGGVSYYRQVDSLALNAIYTNSYVLSDSLVSSSSSSDTIELSLYSPTNDSPSFSFYKFGWSGEYDPRRIHGSVTGPLVGLLLTDSERLVGSPEAAELKRFSITYRHLLESRNFRESYGKVSLQGAVFLKDSITRESSYIADGSFVFDGIETQEYNRLGGRYSFPISNDSDMVVMGYRYNSYQSKKALVLTTDQTFWLNSINKNIFLDSFYGGQVFTRVKAQLGLIEDSGSEIKSLPSFGGEVGFHLLAFGVQDLEAKIGYYHGFDQKAGEDQLYLLIEKPVF